MPHQCNCLCHVKNYICLLAGGCCDNPGILIKPLPLDLSIHILDQGMPLCRFIGDINNGWKKEERWVGILDSDRSNCPDCLTILQVRIEQTFVPIF